MTEDLQGLMVKRLGRLDPDFALNNPEWESDAADFPHAVMMNLAGSLPEQFASAKTVEDLTEPQSALLNHMAELFDNAFQEADSGVTGLIKLGFLEPIYDDHPSLFDLLLSRAGPALRYEMLAHKTEMNGQMICTVIKTVYGPTPPATLGEMCNDPMFVQMISGAGISLTQEAVLDQWDQPYRFSVRVLPEGPRRIYCMVSSAARRDFGADIESCLAAD